MDIQAKLERYRKQKEKDKLLAARAELALTERYLPTFLTGWLGRKSPASDSQASNKDPVLTPVPPLEAQENFLNEKKLKLELRKRGKTTLHNPVKHDDPVSEPDLDVERNELASEWTYLDWLILALKLMLWLILLKIFLHLEFAAVFVAISMFYLMWTNFRKDRRKPWEPSAYSVFNPNCEAIDGTLKPEQFEREIRYGGL